MTEPVDLAELRRDLSDTRIYPLDVTRKRLEDLIALAEAAKAVAEDEMLNTIDWSDSDVPGAKACQAKWAALRKAAGRVK